MKAGTMLEAQSMEFNELSSQIAYNFMGDKNEGKNISFTKFMNNKLYLNPKMNDGGLY